MHVGVVGPQLSSAGSCVSLGNVVRIRLVVWWIWNTCLLAVGVGHGGSAGGAYLLPCEWGVSGDVASSISPWEVREVTPRALSSSDAKDELVKGSMPGAQ